jgi:hypothetical protein
MRAGFRDTGRGHSRMNIWNIQSRAHECKNCGAPFAEKALFHTLLFDLKKEFNRIDVCQGCWESQFAEGGVERKGFVSHWQGVYEGAPPPPPDPIQKETAETLLRRLIEENDPVHGPACFILAVMLERKRLLRVREQFHREGRRYFIYEQPGTGDVFTILDPNLQLDQLDEVQRDVASLLGQRTDGSQPVAPAAPPAPPAAEPASSTDGTAQPAAAVS